MSLNLRFLNFISADGAYEHLSPLKFSKSIGSSGHRNIIFAIYDVKKACFIQKAKLLRKLKFETELWKVIIEELKK